MDRKILLVTTVSWPSVPRYAAGFATAGLQVEALTPMTAPVALSRYVAQIYPYRALTPLTSFKNAIAKSKPDLLLPCDERAVLLLLKLYVEADVDLAALIAHSLGNPSGFAMMMSRVASLAAMRTRGVRVPETYPVPTEDELAKLLETIGFPAVLKVDGTWGGGGVRIVCNRKEATRAFRKLACSPSLARSLARCLKRKDLHFLTEAMAPAQHRIALQRFVEGTPAASAFAAWQGKLAAAFCYDVLVAEGTIGPPNVIRRVDCPEMEEAARIAAESFGLSGLFGMDFIRDAEGKPHLIEINPRGTQGGSLPFGQGCDLPAVLTKSAFGATSGQRAAIENDIVVTFPRLWLNDPQSHWLKIGHHDVPWDDPAVLDATLGDVKQKPVKAMQATHV